MSNQIVRGTMLLTGATFLSKFLGMIYVIPFHELVGQSGGALFNFAYAPYNIFLSISTVGVPLAVSKFVSRYNSLGDYKTSMRMFRAGMGLMAITGITAFLLLFLSAQWIAPLVITNDQPTGITKDDVTMVIRTVSFALIVIPAMSIVRGFFQGHQSMGPTAVSQVVEQIVRILFLLAASFMVLKIWNGTITTAIGFATFAAFVGALASCVVLWVYWQKRKPYIKKQISQQDTTYDVPVRHLFKELFRYAGPFVLVGLATSLYQLIDMFTFERAMTAIGYSGEEWETAYGVINFYGHKIVIIPGTIATGLSLAILPALTSSFTQNNRPLLFQQMNQALQIIAVLVIPAVSGLTVLSDVVYGSLFTLENLNITGSLLGWYAPVGLLFSLFTVTSSILQGINEQRFAVVSLSAGLLIKVLFNIQLIYTFGAKGAIFGTALAAGVAVLLNLWRIGSSINFSFKQTLKRTLLVCIFVIVMCIAIWIVRTIVAQFLPPVAESRWAAIVTLVMSVGIGASIYLWLSYKSELLERTLGDRVRVLDKLFVRKRS